MKKQLSGPLIAPKPPDVIQVQMDTDQAVAAADWACGGIGICLLQSIQGIQAALRTVLHRCPLPFPQPEQGKDERNQKDKESRSRAPQQAGMHLLLRRFLTHGLQDRSCPLLLGNPGRILPQILLKLAGGHLRQEQGVGFLLVIGFAVKEEHRLPIRMVVPVSGLTA